MEVIPWGRGWVDKWIVGVLVHFDNLIFKNLTLAGVNWDSGAVELTGTLFWM